MKAPVRNTTAMKLTTAAFLFLILSTAGAAFAQDFKFDIPTIPYPPKIEDITNTGITPTTAALTVTAKIYGQKQQRPTCDKPDKDDCAMSDWYLADEQEVVPNPPEIKSVKVFYYKNDTAQSALSAAMSLAPELG